ncbi:MAG: hypothetical protein Q9183_001436 [Haloplaca sp. 2 TL-2023]
MSDQLKNPSQWTTGGGKQSIYPKVHEPDQPPSDKQKGFISTLASSKNADVDPNSLNKSEASAKIEELKNQPTENANASAGQPIQNPDSWSTGDDKATGKQMGYVAVMAKEAGEEVPGSMGKTDASKKIEDLKEKTGM